MHEMEDTIPSKTVIHLKYKKRRGEYSNSNISHKSAPSLQQIEAIGYGMHPMYQAFTLFAFHSVLAR